MSDLDDLDGLETLMPLMPVLLEQPENTEALPDAPRDGRAIWVFAESHNVADEHQPVEAVWRQTNKFNFKTRKFEPIGFWALRNSGGAQVPFVPTGWRPL